MSNAPTLLPDLLTSDGLMLRRWLESDAVALGEAVSQNLEHLRPWMPWITQEPLGARERRELIAQWEETWRRGGDVVLGAFLDERVAGGCGLHRRGAPDTLEIGYWVDHRLTRGGLATRIACLLTDAALGVPGIDAVEIHHDKANDASRGVAARAGYLFVGERRDAVKAPGEMGIECVWRVEASSWRRQASRGARLRGDLLA